MINIQDYLKKYSNLYQFEEGIPEFLLDEDDFKSALKEILEVVIDKCAEKAETMLVDNISKIRHEYRNKMPPSGYDLDTEVDKESILNVKNQIDYE